MILSSFLAKNQKNRPSPEREAVLAHLAKDYFPALTALMMFSTNSQP